MICCVAGMHRSGTSLVARWLAESGLPMAKAGSIEPDISNPHGYYEDLDFVRLHARHIRRKRTTTAGWKLRPRKFQLFSPEERVCARQLVAERTACYPDWGWKDPRTTLFLPAWRAIIPELKAILIWRPCAEVVTSLLTRGLKQRRRHLLIDPVSAVRLWRAYNGLICTYQARFPDETLVIASAQLPGTSQAICNRLITDFGFPLIPVSMEHLFVSDLLHPAPRWIQRFCWMLGCDAVEERLQTISVGQL